MTHNEDKIAMTIARVIYYGTWVGIAAMSFYMIGVA